MSLTGLVRQAQSPTSTTMRAKGGPSLTSKPFLSRSIERFQTVDQLLSSLSTLIDQLRENCTPLLLLDLDGTMWRGDLGYAVLECAEEDGLLASGHEPSIRYLRENLSYPIERRTLTAALSHFEQRRSRYRFPSSDHQDGSGISLPLPPQIDQLIEVYQRCASVFFGISARKLLHLTSDVLFRRKSRLGGTFDIEGGIASTVRDEVRAIRRLFGEFGATEVAVTATAAVLAREGSELINIPRDRILGIEFADDVHPHTVPLRRPVPIHAGKGAVAYQWYVNQNRQFKPICAIGDSPLMTDWGLLTLSDIFIDVSGDSYLLIGSPQ